MKEITLEELLEAGCHFGHQVTRQNPKARDFIFEARDGIHIIDLEKTKRELEEAAKFIKEVAKRGGSLLILGTKRQVQPVLDEEIKRLDKEGINDIFWVKKRWIGGTLTNFAEVSKNFRKLKDFEKWLNDDEEKAKYTKREIGEWEKEKQKLEDYYGGVASLSKIPDVLFVIDTHLEDLAVREALIMNIKTVGITDTNSDPTIIDYPIPANDDAVGSLKLIIRYILDAWTEGKKNNQIASKEESEKENKVVTVKEEAGKKKDETLKKAKKDNAVKEKKS